MPCNADIRTTQRSKSAFTLIELLGVLAIMGLLAAAAVPAIRGMKGSSAIIASDQEFQDDLTYARQRAISDHTSVFVLFVPPGIINYTPPAGSDVSTMTQYSNLLGGQFTTYALLSMRSVGEQPGRATPHYLTPWRTLPEGVFFAAALFPPPPPVPAGLPPYLPFPAQALPAANIFPFPNATNFPGINIPYIGFNYLGQLIKADGSASPDVYVPFARGSIFYARDGNGRLLPQPASVQESPNNNSTNTINMVHLNAVTGRNILQATTFQ